MKVGLICANRQFVVGHEGSAAIVAELEGIGFRFGERQVPGGSLLYALGPVELELGTVDELIELQRRIGLPLKLEDGVLEVGYS